MMTKRGALHLLLLAGASVASLGAANAQANRPPTSAEETRPTSADEEIVVTGTVAGATANPSIALSTVTSAEIARQSPLSAADFLKSVPGVFVNSSLGEIRNVVYSRGVSANSLDAASGYYYVSLQEDGLPVTNVTFNNYGPDYFFRPDAGLSRIEALRGGTAVVAGPNAPGGIFNYISRSGKAEPGVELVGRFGLEGDGRFPYYRGDIFAGGRIGNSDFYYSISGFYRQSEGARDLDYPLNRGGQIKGNLVWDYGDGSIMLYGKYLNDRNFNFEFLPARNFNDPKVVPELGDLASLLPRRNVHKFIPFEGGAETTWDGRNLAKLRSDVIGLKFNHKFSGGWEIENNLRYNNNRATLNTGAIGFAAPITDARLNLFLNTNRVGTYTFRDRGTGAIAAQLNRAANGAFTVAVNNLPNQSVGANIVAPQVAFNFNPTVKEVTNQFTVIKRFDTMSFKLGAYYAHSDVQNFTGGGGIGVAGLTTLPTLYDITLTTPAGVIQQLTDPSGFAGIGQRLNGVSFDAQQTQFSAFFGHQWDLTDKLAIDYGVRYESFKVKGSNRANVANPRGDDPTFGGLDNNPNTLFDNYVTSLGPPLSYSRKLDYLSFSGAVTYKFTDRISLFARYSQGKKAPDLQFFSTLATPSQIANIPAIPQKLQQAELGFRYRDDRLRVVVSPFYSNLSQVATPQLFANPDGSSYVPAPLYASLETYGVEIELDFDITKRLNISSAITLQSPKSKNFAIYIANAPGPADDTISRVPDGDSDNNPKLMATTTASWNPVDAIDTFVTWKYLGARAANRFNTFYLPAFSQFDLGVTVKLTKALSITGNINNVLYSKGVLGWAPAGGLAASLDRQAFTPAQLAADPNQLFNIITVQPRSFFLTARVKL